MAVTAKGVVPYPEAEINTTHVDVTDPKVGIAIAPVNDPEVGSMDLETGVGEIRPTTAPETTAGEENAHDLPIVLDGNRRRDRAIDNDDKMLQPSVLVR